MSATFYDEVRQLRRRYPNPLSAVLPALQLAQERNGGWLSEATLREAADALELTPAYCLSIASFYDMFHTEPVGTHLVEVCSSCRGGRTILRSSTIQGPSGMPSSDCWTMRVDSRISSMCTL